VPRSRHLLIFLVLIGLLAMAIPAFSSAACTGAGDSQYCDPLNNGGHTSNSGTGTSSTPAASPSTSTPGTSAAAGTISSTPATTAPAQTTTAGSRTLPFTGYATWEAAGLGLVLVGGGLALRLRARDRRA
jgi:hypothetical protein